MSPFGILAVGLAAVVAVVVRSKVLAARRRRALREWGEARGFAFVARTRRADDLGLDLACLRLGDRRTARNLLEGRRHGRRVLIFDLSWLMGRGEDAVRHERLVAVVEGRPARARAAARTADLARIVFAGLEPPPPALTIRTDVSVRVGRSGGAAPGAGIRRGSAEAEPAAPHVECGGRAVAVVAPRRTPPESLEELLDLAESMFEPATSSAGEPG